MTTTITREERERVAKLLGYEGDPDIIGGSTFQVDVVLDPEDIDRVAQALRDAAPQWREVTETEPAIGDEVMLAPHGGHALVARRKPLGWHVAGLLVEATCKGMHWMPLPAPPGEKPAPAPAPQPIAQPGASEAARIDALERTVTELALAVERLSGGAK